MPLALFAAIVVIITGSLFQRYQKLSGSKEHSTPTAIVEISPSPPPSYLTLPPVFTPSVKLVSPTHSPSLVHPKPTAAMKYPNSQETGPGVYVSSDSADAITEWYTARINQNGYNVKTFIKTNSNGKILNKLVAGKSSQNISVEITKEANQDLTKISVIIDNN